MAGNFAHSCAQKDPLSKQREQRNQKVPWMFPVSTSIQNKGDCEASQQIERWEALVCCEGL
jgi:hypothetical protein